VTDTSSSVEPEFLQRFALTPTEKEIWNAFYLGREIDLRPRERPGLDGSSARRPSAVRAEVLTAMLRHERDPGTTPRLMLRGARISGPLDLTYARIANRISFRECILDAPIDATGAQLSTLSLNDCQLPGIEAPNMELDSDLELRHVSCPGLLNLRGAHLHHDIQLQGAHLGRQQADTIVLAADHMTVDGSVYCHDGFEAIGALSMVGAQVRGTVRLDGAKIIPAGSQGTAPATDAAEPKVAFNGEGMTVGREFSAHNAIAVGEVRLIDATITSTLELRGARLENPDDVALRLDRAEIRSSLYCDGGFTANGEVRAIGTHIKGTAYFNDAQVGTDAAGITDTANPSRSHIALRLVRVTIDGDLGIWRGFTSHGKVILTRSTIAGELTLLTTHLEGDVAADLTNSHIGTLTITGEPPAGLLDLTKVRTDHFSDNPERWQGRGRMVLTGLEYTSIHMDHVTLADRALWLRRGVMETKAERGGYYTALYRMQPYEQLAQAYRRVGDDQAAHSFLLEGYRQRNRATPWRRWYLKIWYFLQDVLVGYGYAPLRALVWFIALFVLGTLLFRYVAPPQSAAIPPKYFTLTDSLNYTLNLLLPFSGLRAEELWRSGNAAGDVASALVIMEFILFATVIATAVQTLRRTRASSTDEASHGIP
jgi:hypothetical protein